jgi:hypothetical protein
MHSRLCVTIRLGQPEIDHIDLIPAFPGAHEEVAGLEVSMDDVSRVDVFYTSDELVCEEENGLE